MLNRRRFNAAVTVNALGLAASTRGISFGADEPAKKYPAGTFFDLHTHFGLTTNYRPMLTVEALLRWMDAHDVAQAAVLPLVSPEASTFPLSPDDVLSQTKPYRDRLVPFCCFDPRADYGGGQRGLVGVLSGLRRGGCQRVRRAQAGSGDRR